MNKVFGKIEKLKFTAFSEVSFANDKKLGEYSVMINPESFNRKMNVLYIKEQPKGGTATDAKSDKIRPESYSFNFIIDGTGVVDVVKENKKETVAENIDRFLRVVYNYNSEEHRTPYVQIEYCGMIMQCVLDSLDISYTLFKSDGTPLRAKVSCSFSSAKSKKMESLQKDDKSPDITHQRVLKEGEKLISFSNKIYKSNLYYLDVAEKNNLNNFREVKPGTAIYFPPLKN